MHFNTFQKGVSEEWLALDDKRDEELNLADASAKITGVSNLAPACAKLSIEVIPSLAAVFFCIISG